MNGKTVAYMVAAVAVGYFLVASIPQRVAMYAAPTSLRSAGGETMLGAEPGSGVVTSPMPDESEAGALGAGEKEGTLLGPTGYSMYAWWALDLAVAVSVYWLARRRFT